MSASQECVSKWISEIHDHHPELKNSQIVAMAYSKCGAKKSDFTDGFCPYKILAKQKFMKAIHNDLKDYSELPLSTRISAAVDANLETLIQDFPHSDEFDILKVAYSIAQRALDISDFEEINEEPVFFQIYIEDPEAFSQALYEEMTMAFPDSSNEDFSIIIYTDDNQHKIQQFNLLEIKPAVKFKKEDLEPEKLQFFEKIANDDLKNIPPIFIDENNQIWDGHHRYFSLKQLKQTIIYAIQLPQEILKQIYYEDYLKSWNYSDTSNINVTRFDTLLNRDLRNLFRLKNHSDFTFTDDKIADKFFAAEQPVQSSNVAEIGYDQGKLVVYFNNGWGYEYDVPSSWYMQMLNAPSKGQFVWNTLRGRTPGRVIDNPNKITPGGVGGSLVPYFKVKGHRMPKEEMRKSVKSFLKAAKKGSAQVGGLPIRQISKPQFKEFNQFLNSYKSNQGLRNMATRTFSRIKSTLSKIKFKKGKEQKEPKKKNQTSVESPIDNKAILDQIKHLQNQLKLAKKAKLDITILQLLENQIEKLNSSISDFVDNFTDDFYTDPYIDDMQYFKGPITRAGGFEYGDEIKYKDMANLREAFNKTRHLPTFDAHNEHKIIGFAFNFTDNPDLYMKDDPDYEKIKNTPYIYSEGYSFNNIEEEAVVPLDSSTKIPVSIRYIDANKGTMSPDQKISDLIHLAQSVNRTDRDRCSSGDGMPCWVRYQSQRQTRQDFLDTQAGDPPMPKGDKEEEEKEEEEEEKPPKDKKEDEDSSDMVEFVKVPKKKFLRIINTFDDMVERDKVREKEFSDMKAEIAAEKAKIQKEKFESDFSKHETWIITEDFKKNATVEDFAVLKKALKPVEQQINPDDILFGGKGRTKLTEDFKHPETKELDDYIETLKKEYGVKK